jgi:hypothetical protein
MKNFKKLMVYGFLSALGVSLYTLLVSFVMNNGQKWFGQANGVLGPMLILMLLVFSVAVVGSLLFGWPAYLVMTGDKSIGIKQLFYNLGWLAIAIIVFLVVLLLRNSGV